MALNRPPEDQTRQQAAASAIASPPPQSTTPSPSGTSQATQVDLTKYDLSSVESIDAAYQDIWSNYYIPLLNKVQGDPVLAEADGSAALVQSYAATLTQLKTRQSGLYQQQARENNAKDPALVQSQILQNEAQVKEIDARTKLVTYQVDHPKDQQSASSDPEYIALQKQELQARIDSNRAQIAHEQANEARGQANDAERNRLEGERVDLERQRVQLEGQRVANDTTQTGAQVANYQANTALTNQRAQQEAAGPLVTLIGQLKAGIKGGTLTPDAAKLEIDKALGYGTPESRAAAQQAARQAALSDAMRAGLVVAPDFREDAQGNLARAFGKVGIDYRAPTTAPIPFEQWAAQILQAAPQSGLSFSPQGDLSGLSSTIAGQVQGAAITPAQVAANPAAFAGTRFIGGPLDGQTIHPSVTAGPTTPASDPHPAMAPPLPGAPVNPAPRY